MNKATFLDLQGTLGGKGLGDIRDFSFYSFSFQAIKLINSSDYFAFILTDFKR